METVAGGHDLIGKDRIPAFQFHIPGDRIGLNPSRFGRQQILLKRVHACHADHLVGATDTFRSFGFDQEAVTIAQEPRHLTAMLECGILEIAENRGLVRKGPGLGVVGPRPVGADICVTISAYGRPDIGRCVRGRRLGLQDRGAKGGTPSSGTRETTPVSSPPGMMMACVFPSAGRSGQTRLITGWVTEIFRVNDVGAEMAPHQDTSSRRAMRGRTLRGVLPDHRRTARVSDD